jgi:flavin-binding protein dodecin
MSPANQRRRPAEGSPAEPFGLGLHWQGRQDQENIMAVAKVVEISAASKTSFEDAIIQGVKRADDTIDNIEGAWIQEQKVIIKNGKIDEYRVNMRVTFILK